MLMDLFPEIIWHFLARFVIRMLMTMIMPFSVIYVNFGSTLNLTIFIILIINICKETTVLGTVLLAQAHYFLLTT